MNHEGAHAAVSTMVEGIELRSAPLRVSRARVAGGTEICVCVTQSTEIKWTLGAIDQSFVKGKRPSFVELAMMVHTCIDPSRLAMALRLCLEDGAAMLACGRRQGATTIVASHFRFTTLTVDNATLLRRPADHCLFDTPRADAGGATDMLTLRLSTSPSAGSAIGITWDHALCDVGGIALFLERLSAAYTGSHVPAPLHGDRELQKLAMDAAAPTMRDLSSTRGSVLSPLDGGVQASKGGVATVEWRYTASDLSHLKAAMGAQTRHDALWADIICLLRDSGHPINTVSISRDSRGRGPLPKTHFGNATLIVSCQLPLPPADRGMVAAAVRRAIEADAAEPQLRQPADLHLTSWWHPLQRSLSFEGVAPSTPASTASAVPQPSFAIGPAAVAVAARICANSGGRPNATVLPAIDRGLCAMLQAPMTTARALVHLLRKRATVGDVHGELPCAHHTTPPCECLSASYGCDSMAHAPCDMRLLERRWEYVVALAGRAAEPPTSALPPPHAKPVSAPQSMAREPAAGRAEGSSVPCGHTYFSWVEGQSASLPPGHTPFSWGIQSAVPSSWGIESAVPSILRPDTSSGSMASSGSVPAVALIWCAPSLSAGPTLLPRPTP